MSITVVAPNLNEMPYIRSWFLRSLREQTHPPREVIIVDGGSTDGSEAYASFTCTTRNIGLCRDMACKRATGDIILSASTDCWYPSTTLHLIAKTFNDPAVASLSGRIMPSSCGIAFHLSYGMFEAYRQLSRRDAPSASLYAVRRSVLEAVGGFPHIQVREGEALGEVVAKYSRVNDLKTLHKNEVFGLHHVKEHERSPLDYAYLFVPQLREAQGRRFSSK